MTPYTSPDFSSTALITIDTQRDTLDGQPFEIPGTSAILPQIKLLLLAFRHAALPIVHVVRLYRPDGNNVDLCRRSLVEGGTFLLCPGHAGSELASELLPTPDMRLDADLLLAGGIQPLGPNEVVMYKPRWGAFFRTPLEDHLHRLGVTSLAFTGCNFPNCPRTSVYEASERDFRVVLVEDALSGLYDRGKVEIANIGVTLMKANELMAAISSSPPKHKLSLLGDTEDMPWRFRTVTPDDYARVIQVVDAWWGGRAMTAMLPKLFFVHFRETSFVAEVGDELIGFLVGFLSPAVTEEAYIHFVGVHPEYRKRGVGRGLYEQLFHVARMAGRCRVRCVTSPVNNTSIAFHRMMGFHPCGGADGDSEVPIHRDYDGAGEDRVLLAKEL